MANYKHLRDFITPEEFRDAMKRVGIGKQQASRIINGRSVNMKFIEIILQMGEARLKRLEKSLTWQKHIEEFCKPKI